MSSRSGRIEPIPRKGVVVTQTSHAVIFFDDDTGVEVAVPKSQVKSWCFVDSKSADGLRLVDLRRDDEILLAAPRWLWVKEGLMDE
jgi:hypothetical protein